MQTFLPYAGFRSSMQVLDYRRLGKQRVEARQILTALEFGSVSRWRNHPAVLMWKGYEWALQLYSNEAILEWSKRGYKNTMTLFSVDMSAVIYPKWIGNTTFHASHRSNLLRKDPIYYAQFNWREPSDLPYFWPTKEGY